MMRRKIKNMKKILKLLLILLILTLGAAVLTLPAGAQDAGMPDYSEEYENMLDGIPDDIAALLPEGFFSKDPGEVYGAAVEASGFSYVIKTIATLAGVHIGGALRLLAQLLGLLMLSALLRSVRDMIKSPGIAQALSLCSVSAVLGAVISVQYEQLRSVSIFLDRLNILADSMLPLMGTLYAMGGNVSAAAVNNGSMLLFMSVIEKLCNRSVLPVTAACLALSLVGSLSPSIDLRGVSTMIKKSYTFVIGFVMTLLIATLAAQSTLASAGDSLAARGAKFMAGSFIPVVGGAVGESLKTVAGSIAYIRGGAGIGGIVIICLLLLPTLISIITTRLAFMAAGTAAKLLGCSLESDLLGELSNIYGYLLAVVASCSVLFIFALTLLARTSAAIV